MQSLGCYPIAEHQHLSTRGLSCLPSHIALQSSALQPHFPTQPPPASADLLNQKALSAAIAVTIATTAIETCKTNGYAVSATIVGRNGEVIVQIRGDGTGPHTMENSFKKAFTARTFRIPSGEMEERLKKNPQMGAQYLTGFTTARGALPIKVGEETIGAAGVRARPARTKMR